MYRLTDSFPYLLNRVGVRMGELFERRLAPYGVTVLMYRVLAALCETADQRLGDLAAMTTVEMSTLSRLVGEMKRRGLVSRRRPKDNGRTVAISLTTKGRALAEELMPIARHFEEVATCSFARDDVAWLDAALATVYSNLDAVESEIDAVAGALPARISRRRGISRVAPKNLSAARFRRPRRRDAGTT